MSEDLKSYSPTDPELVDKIVNNIKSKGIFDQFRKDCLADVDTKPAYQNLQQRVNGTVTGFLATQQWQHGLNKTQLRESLRRHTVQQAFLEVGVDRIVDQVVNPKIYSVFMPKVEDVVCELLGIEKPKPKPLALNFQEFKKSLEAQPTREPAPAAPSLPAPSPEPVKNELVKTEEKRMEESSPVEDKPLEPLHTCPTPPLKEEHTELPKDSDPMSPGGSVSEMLNNDDDSNTIDEMPLLAASLDSDSNRGGSSAMEGAPQNSSTKVGAISEMSDSNSLLSTRPPLEYDSSTNNLSSLKSEEKMSPSKKFDNFSNLGEKLKQADVNLRETSIKKEDIMEESSDVTKSSENDTESFEMKIDLPSESNMSSVDVFRHEPMKIDLTSERIFSEDSQSSLHSSKSKSRQAETRDSRSHKHEKNTSSTKSKDRKSTKGDKKDDSLDDVKDAVKKDPIKVSYSSKQHESKSRSKEGYKDKSKSGNDTDRYRDDKHKSSKDKSHSSDKHGRSDSTKDRKDKRDRHEDEDEKNDEDPKLADSHKLSEKKKKKEDDKSRQHSNVSKNSKIHKKFDDRSKSGSKEKNKSTEKEKSEDQNKTVHDKSKKDSGCKSSLSKSGDRKHKDDTKKGDDKKDNDDDRKKSPRKRKSGRCEDDEIKSKNSRRSSDRDSNGNAGGGFSKSMSSNSSHNGRKSSKSDKGRSHTKSKEPSEQSDALGEDYEINHSPEVGEADEVDMILMEINNSIQNKNQRLNISEVLNEPTMKKPKIARNFYEIKKIMQVRKDIDRRISNDLKSPLSHRRDCGVEEKITPEQIDTEQEYHCKNVCNQRLPNSVPNQNVSTIPIISEDEDHNDKVRRAASSALELKDCSIVVTDVLRGQFKNSFISSFTNKRIILEDGAVKKITPYSPNSSDDMPHENEKEILPSENPSNTTVPGEHSGSSSERFSFSDEIDPLIQSVVSEEDNDYLCISSTCNQTTKSADKTKFLQTAQMADGENQGSVGIPDSTLCSVFVPSRYELDVDFKKTEVVETTQIFNIRVTPGCSSDIAQHHDENESDNSGKTQPKMMPVKPSSTNTKPVTRSKSCTDQSMNTSVPIRSRRSNAGTLMYAVLEDINDKVPPNSLSVTVNRSSRRKGPKLEISKKIESVAGSEDPVNNSKSSQASDNESFSAVEPSKTCSTDDGSDVSNKENDVTNVACKTRSQMMDLGCNEVKNVETRSTRRKTLTNDSSEDLNKSTDNNNATKGRVSLKCKNNQDELGCLSEEIPAKAEVDPESKKFNISVSSWHCNRKGGTPLYLRSTELEKGSLVNTSADSCTANSLLDKPMFSKETYKSTEPLNMEKENITLPISLSVDQSLTSLSPRRKSCPDISEPFETRNSKGSLDDKVPTSAIQENSLDVKLDFKTSVDVLRGSSPHSDVAVALTENLGCANRRSGRRLGNAVNNEFPPTKDNKNGNEISRNGRKLCRAGGKLPHKTVEQGFSSNSCGKLESSIKSPICSSVSLITSKQCSEETLEAHTLVLPSLQHPDTITINIDSSIDETSKDEPPQVTLYFDDSSVATFNSEGDAEKFSLQTVCMSEDVRLIKHAGCEIDLSIPTRVANANTGRDVSQIEEKVEVEGPSCSAVEKNHKKGKHPLSTILHQADSLLEDSCSSEFKGFSEEKPDQDLLEKEYKGFTDDEIQEATVQLHLLKQYIANQLQSPSKIGNQAEGPPRAKKTRVASTGVLSISDESTKSPANRRTPRKRIFSLNSSPEKDKKEVLGVQCKAESKDSGLCESPERPSFVSDMDGNYALKEPGGNTVRTRKMANVSPTSTCSPDRQRTLRKDRNSGTVEKKNSVARNPQRYSAVDLYKPRPVVGRDTRTSRATPNTSRGRPKRAT